MVSLLRADILSFSSFTAQPQVGARRQRRCRLEEQKLQIAFAWPVTTVAWAILLLIPSAGDAIDSYCSLDLPFNGDAIWLDRGDQAVQMRLPLFQEASLQPISIKPSCESFLIASMTVYRTFLWLKRLMTSTYVGRSIGK